MKSATRFAIVLLLIAGFNTLTIETSSAQCGYGGFGQGLYGGYGGFGYGGFSTLSPYASGRIPTPPYFALHPPVYYSQPVARTYGYSPFAYPGTVRTPEVVEEAPIPFSMNNPYVPSADGTEESAQPEDYDDEYAVKPQVIENPYVLDHPLQIDSTELVAID